MACTYWGNQRRFTSVGRHHRHRRSESRRQSRIYQFRALQDRTGQGQVRVEFPRRNVSATTLRSNSIPTTTWFRSPATPPEQDRDPTTGLGLPVADQLVDALAQQVSPGDGIGAIAGSKPHGEGNPHNSNNGVKPH